MSPTREATPLTWVGGAADAPDIQHATGFTAPDPFLCVMHRGRAHLIVSQLELGRAQACPGRVTCHAIGDLDLAPGRRTLGDQLAALARRQRWTRIRVSPRCPVGVVRTVEAAGISVEVNPDPQRPGRLIKTEAEITELRRAQRAAVAGIRSARSLIASATADRKGVLRGEDGKVLTSEAVRAAIAHTLLDHGCVAEELIVAGGDQAVDPHERGHGPLHTGEWIILDVFPQSATGYWGDITRTVIHGTPSPEQQRLYATVRRAQQQAVGLVKSGRRGSTIHQHIVKVFEAAGYPTGRIDGVPQGFIHSTGHGVGLEIHEEPRIAPGAGPLRSGMVVTIEPGLYYRGLGGVRIEDTVVVTQDGCEALARCSKGGCL